MQEQTQDQNELQPGVHYEQKGTGLKVAAIIFGVLGGLLGLAFGIILKNSKVNINGGNLLQIQ